jgi:alpha-1,3-rhamnosyl/mannosyltransferase
MRVGFELTALELDSTGTARAIRSLERELATRVDLVAFGHPRGGGGRIRRALARELWWFPVALPRAAIRARLDVLHCPAPLAPLRSPVPLVVTLYDTAGFDHPEWLTRENALHQRFVVAPALRSAARVVTSSEFARERIARHVRVPLERIEVVPLGVDPVFGPGAVDEHVLARLGVKRPYVLTVGTLQPRKNLEAALTAFELLDDGLQLVVAGARGWSDAELVARLGNARAADRIKLAGRLSDDDLVSLYRGAGCLIYPSRYEGFGLPPLEAMACGTPVVASNATSIPEVVGDAALLAEPDDPATIAAAVEDALARREELAARAREHAAQFTWGRTADALTRVYEAVAGSGSRCSSKSRDERR